VSSSKAKPGQHVVDEVVPELGKSVEVGDSRIRLAQPGSGSIDQETGIAVEGVDDRRPS